METQISTELFPEVSKNNSTFIVLYSVDDEGGPHFMGDLNERQSKLILWILTVLVCPCISVLGLIGNTFSLIILRKHGLNKCSNILLYSLAISDITFLVGANINALCRKVHDVGIVKGFALPYTVAYFVYVIHNIADVMDWVGCAISFTLPVLITVERCVAVFLPMKFPQIVTPKRTTIAVASIFIFWYGLMIYTRIWFTFVYSNDNPYNISVGVMERSVLFYQQQDASEGIQTFIAYVAFLLPLPLVAIGCICIGVKVRLASIKRGKMTSSSSAVNNEEENKKFAALSRTTRTLISVCAVYSVASLFTTLPQHMPQFLVYTLFTDAPNNTALVVYQSINVVLSLNSSCNFLIYVATNNKFRQTHKQILTDCISICRKAEVEVKVK